MPHHRTTIRNALATAVSGVGFTVFPERQDRIDSTLRPCAVMSLTSADEDSTRRKMGWSIEHAQTVLFELHADAPTGREVAEAIDAMELAIEAAVAGSDGGQLGGLVLLIEPAGSELEMSREQSTVVGVRSVSYTASWRAPFGQPDNPET